MSALLSVLTWVAFALLSLAQSTATITTINATYGSSPAPFRIDVNPEFVQQIEQKVANFRYTKDDLGLPPFTDGPPLADAQWFQRTWADSYNWTQTQTELNAFWSQYTTVITTTESNYTEPVPLHFVHHLSPRSDAIPLLFLHGWPGSFLEVGKMINNLTNPPDPSLPAFHVVAPSIPGFAFSPAPIKPGYGPVAAAHTFHALMQQLGYNKYVMQGGDLGAFIMRFQAILYPDAVVSILSNLWSVAPTEDDLTSYEQNLTSPDVTTYIYNFTRYTNGGSGYRYIQATLPLQLAWSLTDSPLGNLLWNWELTVPLGPFYNWTAEEYITWSMMYYIQGPYGGLRMYKEFAHDGVWSDHGPLLALPYVNVPVAITQRPFDVGWKLPLDWARREGNVVKLYEHEFGGHFAAYQTPESLLQDCWDFWGNGTLSGTDIFGI